MKNKIASGTLNAFIGIGFLIFFISLGLYIAINCRIFYYADIPDLSAETGYSEDIIKENYDALIDYCSPFFKGDLNFPSLPASESGISHFAEVKVIFNVFFYIMLVSPVILTILIFAQHKRKDYSFIKWTPIIMCVAPIVVFALCAIDFESTFIMFHKIIFRNEDWYFKPDTDPIIMLLPESFFLKCALIMVTTVLIGCAIFVVCNIFRKKRR